MRQLVKFEENHVKALAEIEEFASATDDLGDLVRLLLETSVNPYGFMPEGWASAMCSAQGFSSLCYALHHALYDDGDVTFFTVNGEPKFGFFHSSEATDENCLNSAQKHSKKAYGRNHEIKLVHLKELIEMFKPFHANERRMCFIQDAARHGVEVTLKHYAEDDGFNKDLATDTEVLEEIKKEHNKLVAHGLLKE